MIRKTFSRIESTTTTIKTELNEMKNLVKIVSRNPALYHFKRYLSVT